MTKTKLLILATVLLSILNVTLLVFCFKNGPHVSHNPEEKVSQMLGLDSSQKVEYKLLIKEHQLEINELGEDIKKFKAELYVLGPEDVEERELLVKRLGDLHAQKERIHVGHFNDIESLCRPEQIDRMQELRNDLGNIFRTGPPPAPKKK